MNNHAYTIDELENIVTDGSNAVDITDIVDQLLDTMRALEAAQMRLEAAASIEFMAHDFTITEDVERHFGKVDGWNACLLAFRAALEGE